MGTYNARNTRKITELQIIQFRNSPVQKVPFPIDVKPDADGMIDLVHRPIKAWCGMKEPHQSLQSVQLPSSLILKRLYALAS